MPASKSSRILNFFLRLWIGAIFTYAGYSKLMEPIANFRGSLAEYQVFPYAWLQPIAMTVPWFEFISGIFMILGLAIPVTALIQTGMFFVFLTVIGSSNVLLESATKECGCFGLTSPIRMTVWQIFLMDLLNFGIAIKLCLAKTSPFSLDNLLSRGNKTQTPGA